MLLPEGGLPTNQSHDEPNTYATSYGLRALKNEPDAVKKDIGKFLVSSQNLDGGWGLKKGDPSEPTLTAYVLHGLLDGGSPWGSEIIKRGIGFLLRARKKNGTWGSWLSEAESVEGTAFCLYILRRAGVVWEESDDLSLEYLSDRVMRGDAFKMNNVDQLWVAVSVLLAAHVCESIRY
jgi:hypothetical protein